MNRSELEAILQEHLRGTQGELRAIFRGVEDRLDSHIAKTEAAIAEALSRG